VGAARKRCWKNNWVLLYIERWLKAPVEFEDGTQQSSEKGTPQGGVISPLLANLFLHYAFDQWIEPLAKLWVDEQQSHFESIFGME